MSFATVCLYSMYRMRKEMSQTRIFTDAWNQILAEGGNPNLGTENLAVFKFEDVKVRRTSDAVITVDLPFDDSMTNITDIEICNVACVAFTNAYNNDYDVYWYWVNDYTEISRAPYDPGDGSSVERMNYRFTLELNPTATVFSDDDDLAIIPERLPFETDGVRQNWTTSIMAPGTPNTTLPKIPKCPISKTRATSTDPYTEQGTVWVEVTFSETSPDKLKRYGFFAAVNPSDELPTVYTNVFVDTYSGDQQIHVYPTVAQIIANPETYLGLSSVTIHDINISEYCPFSAIGDISVDSQDNSLGMTLIALDNSRMTPAFCYRESTTIGLSTVYIAYHAFDISAITDYRIGVDQSGTPAANSGSVTITLTDYEKHCGEIAFLDSMRNSILTIPKERNENTMAIDYSVFSDSSNIYLALKYDEIYHVIPGYKIPWMTSSWDTYRAFNLQYDRQALQNNIDMTNREFSTSVINGASNGIIGGAVSGAMVGGAAGAGLGAATGVSSLIATAVSGSIDRDRSIEKMRRDQELTEQRMRHGAANLNNPAYGSSIINNILAGGGSGFVLLLPMNYGSTGWTSQTELWGFPANKNLTSVDFSQLGTILYFKGQPVSYDTHIGNYGSPMHRAMEREFMNGIRLMR